MAYNKSMKYIVAVSGGIDSVALLHMLRHQSAHDLIVAHVDHGIRLDSSRDRDFVEQLAKNYGLTFVSTSLGLGPNASEAEARTARYEWLERIKEEHGAAAIATAHHQDDVIETVILNIMRGTGWRGLASLRSTEDRYRPLLTIPKATLTRYAIDNQLLWREDSTNQDIRYTRNYIRHVLIPRLTPDQRRRLLKLAQHQWQLRSSIEKEVDSLHRLTRGEHGLSRYQLIMSPEPVALELLRHVTRAALEPYQLRRLLHFVKTGRQGAVLQLGGGKNALLTRQYLVV